MDPTKKKTAAEGKKKGYVSQENSFNRAFRDRLLKWAIKHKSRKPGDPKVPIAEGPELAHFIGMLLSYDSLSEEALGKTLVGSNWKLWKETYPDAAEVMLRFVQQTRTKDGKSFRLADYEQKRTGRLHLVVSYGPDDADDADDENDEESSKKGPDPKQKQNQEASISHKTNILGAATAKRAPKRPSAPVENKPAKST